MSIDRRLLAVAVFILATPVVHAAPCTDTSNFDEVMQAVDQAVPCGSATKHKRYVKDAKRALGGMLSKSCKKLFVKRFINQSTCGRTGFQVCCDTNSKGKNISKVVKAGKCKGDVCAAAAPTNVGEGCTASGACATTTTTTTTTSSTSSTNQPTTTAVSTTTTTTVCTGNCFSLDFTLGAPVGVCGSTQNGAGGLIKNLTCGGLNIGGGKSFVAEGPTPDGSVSRFALDCDGDTCTIGATTQAPALNSTDPDCTAPGCNFGTPLPIPNAGTSTCVLNTWTAPATGTLDLATGTSTTNVPLQSLTILTGNVLQPCPRCSATGSPGNPGTGTCDRGPRTGLTCVTTNSQGLTRDCPTGGADATHPCTPGTSCIDGTFVGTIPVDLSPLTTGTSSKTNAGGVFCPGQTSTGCFGSAACVSITENGSPASAITVGVPATATLASVFCIPMTGNQLIDGTAALAGPGAVSLPGTFVAH